MNRLPAPPPHSAPIPAEEVKAGERLTEALLTIASEHACEHGSIAAARGLRYFIERIVVPRPTPGRRATDLDIA